MIDLRTRSKSLDEYVASWRSNRNWLLDQVAGQMLGNVLDGAPDQLVDMLKDQGKFTFEWMLAAVSASQQGGAVRNSPAVQQILKLASKSPTVKSALMALARNQMHEPIRRMLMVANANNLDPERSRMRYVDSTITPYSAKTQYHWQGTLAEFRLGSILTGPADPRTHFTIYIPQERANLRGDFILTRIVCDHQ